MSIDEYVDPGKCKHIPKRVYVWDLDATEGRTPKVYGTCANCRTDYHIPTTSLVDMIPDESIIVQGEPFHVALRKACQLYRSSLKEELEETDK